jgi:hypothetical protein
MSDPKKTVLTLHNANDFHTSVTFASPHMTSTKASDSYGTLNEDHKQCYGLCPMDATRRVNAASFGPDASIVSVHIRTMDGMQTFSDPVQNGGIVQASDTLPRAVPCGMSDENGWFKSNITASEPALTGRARRGSATHEVVFDSGASLCIYQHRRSHAQPGVAKRGP